MVLPLKNSFQNVALLAGNPLRIEDVEITERDEVIMILSIEVNGSKYVLYPIWHNEDWKPIHVPLSDCANNP